MKSYIIALCSLVLVGCSGLNRLINGAPDTAHDVTTIGGPVLGPAPEFNIPLQPGLRRIVSHDFLSASHTVRIDRLPNSLLFVFIKEGGGVNAWFKIGRNTSAPFYYDVNPLAMVVSFYGMQIANKEYCICQDVPL